MGKNIVSSRTPCDLLFSCAPIKFRVSGVNKMNLLINMDTWCMGQFVFESPVCEWSIKGVWVISIVKWVEVSHRLKRNGDNLSPIDFGLIALSWYWSQVGPSSCFVCVSQYFVLLPTCPTCLFEFLLSLDGPNMRERGCLVALSGIRLEFAAQGLELVLQSV